MLGTILASVRIVSVCLSALLVLGLGSASALARDSAPSHARGAQDDDPRPRSGWQLPLDPPLVLERAFERPPERWAAGHRGVDLRAEPGSAVLSPRAGTVSFVGLVAGRGVVTVTHQDGLRSSLEPVEALVVEGDQVEAGESLGTLEARASHCAPLACVHWGVREGTDYLDPLMLVRGGPTVLLPGP